MNDTPETLDVRVSARAVELVRKKISNAFITASDSDVARALGLSRGAVWAYKNGRDCMSHQTLLKVQQVAELNEWELTELMFDILIEGDPPDVNFLLKAKKRIGRVMRRQARNASSILLATLALLGLSALPGQSARAVDPGDAAASVYYVKLSPTRLWRTGPRSGCTQRADPLPPAPCPRYRRCRLRCSHAAAAHFCGKVHR